MHHDHLFIVIMKKFLTPPSHNNDDQDGDGDGDDEHHYRVLGDEIESDHFVSPKTYQS